jgi:hypothetical protein
MNILDFLLGNRVVSPLPDSPLQKAAGSVGRDVQSAVEISPAGDLVKRLINASHGTGWNRQAPSVMDQIQPIPGAIRTASYGLLPGAVAAGGLASGGMEAIKQGLSGKQNDEQVLASGIEGGRQTALLAPLLLGLFQGINGPRLRSNPRDPGDERLIRQTLIDNLLSRINK